jgi:hypothetical protein
MWRFAAVLVLLGLFRGASGLSNSKLSVQTGPNVGQATTDFVKASPRVLKLFGGSSFDFEKTASNVKQVVPGIMIIGLIEYASPPQNGSAEAAAQAWWSANKGVIQASSSGSFFGRASRSSISSFFSLLLPFLPFPPLLLGC